VIRDSAGNLYGTTSAGGTHRLGNIFRLTPQRRFTDLYNFTGGADGAEPFSALIRDSAGNLYGTTSLGGTHQNGVVFKLTPAGKLVVLYSFGTVPSDGASPSDLIMDAQGNLYGATTSGGKDGKYPTADPLALDPAGNLYGTDGGAEPETTASSSESSPDRSASTSSLSAPGTTSKPYRPSSKSSTTASTP